MDISAEIMWELKQQNWHDIPQTINHGGGSQFKTHEPTDSWQCLAIVNGNVTFDLAPYLVPFCQLCSLDMIV